jgi:hypothetical protein
MQLIQVTVTQADIPRGTTIDLFNTSIPLDNMMDSLFVPKGTKFLLPNAYYIMPADSDVTMIKYNPDSNVLMIDYENGDLETIILDAICIIGQACILHPTDVD